MIINISEVYDVIQTVMDYKLNKAINAIKYNDRRDRMNDSINYYSLYIPKKHARGEIPKTDYTYEQAMKEDSYQFILPIQIGRFFTRKETTILYKANESTYIRFIIYPDKGFDIDDNDHVSFIRNTDEKDRQIIKGFINSCLFDLKTICHGEDLSLDNISNIQKYAANFTIKKAPKRVNLGKIDDFESYEFYRKAYGGYKPYEESSIFNNVALI